jgi:carbon-monoxide dehydrogenase small subunit
MIRVDLVVNGEPRRDEVAPNLTLLEYLREVLCLTGAKEGCGVGECGNCLVLVDGDPVNSCLVLIGDASGHEVETIEGLGGDEGLDEVQAAFVEVGAFQCGFCTPAMVLATKALLRGNPRPERAEVVEALAGVLCRCGSHPRVLAAVRAAAERGTPR